MSTQQIFTERPDFREKFDETLETIYGIRNEKVGDLNKANSNCSINMRTKMAMIHPIQAEIEMVDKILKLLNNLRKVV
jgi:hypothetical protein